MNIKPIEYKDAHLYVGDGLIYGTLGSMVGVNDPEVGVYVTLEDLEAILETTKPAALVKDIREILLLGRDYYEKNRREEMAAARIRRPADTTPKPEERGMVYILTTSVGTKIGISAEHNIESRMKAFELMPIEHRECRILAVDRYRRAERQLHEEFADKRTKGEWFALNDGDIKKAVLILESEFNGQWHSGTTGKRGRA